MVTVEIKTRNKMHYYVHIALLLCGTRMLTIIDYKYYIDIVFTINGCTNENIKISYVFTVPTAPKNPNQIIVVGGVSGQIGVVTLNGYGTHQQLGENKEGCIKNPICLLKTVIGKYYTFTECKNIWWGYVHDGPISCIKRNVFYPDIHLVCGGHVVSIWSLNYNVNNVEFKPLPRGAIFIRIVLFMLISFYLIIQFVQGGPVWWKRFGDFTNSVLWSTTHPAEFRVSFNTSGELQFWNFMKFAHQPYYTFDFLVGDGLISSKSVLNRAVPKGGSGDGGQIPPRDNSSEQ